MTTETRLSKNSDGESSPESREQFSSQTDISKAGWVPLASGSKAPALRGWVGQKDRKPVLLAMAIWLPVAILALVGYFWVKVPLEERLLASETLRLVGDINSLVKSRSSIMAITSDYLRKDGEISRESLDGIFEGLKNRFPDFLCLELINAKGEITAMVGDLPVSQAGLASRTQIGRFKNLGLALGTDVEVLQDNPEAGLFFVTRRHSVSGLEDQFIRAKFARGPLALTLAAAGNGSVSAARLIPIYGGSVDDWQVAAGSGNQTEARIVGDLWHGPIRGEALLNTKGWAVSLTRVGSPAFLSYVLFALFAFGGILVFLAVRLSTTNLNYGNREYAGTLTQYETHPPSAFTSREIASGFAADKSSEVFGVEPEPQITDFWGEDYVTSDLFNPGEPAHSETSETFFGGAPTSSLGVEPDESLFGREDHATRGKEPLQITWYEPFGSAVEEEAESDTSAEVSAESGESFDRA